MSSNAPVAKLIDGTVQVAIWRNEGKNGVFYAATATNRYRDENDEWHDGDNYTGTDLLKLRRLSEKAYDTIVELRTKDKDAREERE